MPGLQISCTIPMCLAMRRSHQLVKICDVFSHFLRCTLGMHIKHPSISRPQTQLWMWGYTRWFWSPCWTVLQTDPWEPSLCKSTHEKHPPAWKKNLPFWSLSSSNHIWLHKVDIYVETMVYIHLANSWDHDFMCPSLIFPHQKTVFDHLHHQPLVVQLSCTRLR